MNQTQKRSKAIERAKIALVPVLAGVLGVVVLQNGDHAATPAPTTVAAPARRSAVETSTQAALLQVRQRSWPDVELNEILSRNPFALPSTSGSEKTAPVSDDVSPPPDVIDQEILLSIESLNLQAIYESDSGRSALVGTRVLHVGDRLGENLRVSDIRPDGVVIEIVDR